MLIIIVLILSPLHIIMEADINDTKINVVLRVRFFFSIIRFKIKLYPKKHKANKKANKKIHLKKKAKQKPDKKQKRRKIKVSRTFIYQVQRFIKNIQKEELFLYIRYGSESKEVTSFVYVLISAIYGHVISYMDAQKTYFNIIPSYVEPVTKCKFKIHIKITFGDFIQALKLLFRFIKDNKGEMKIGRSKFNKKSHGDNS